MGFPDVFASCVYRAFEFCLSYPLLDPLLDAMSSCLWQSVIGVSTFGFVFIAAVILFALLRYIGERILVSPTSR